MNKISFIRIRGVVLFAGVVFWPAILFFIFYAWAMADTSFVKYLLKTTGVINFKEVFIGYGTLFIQILVILVSYSCCVRATWGKRCWVIYTTWIVLIMEMSFFMLAALGGASMAVVEGGAGPMLYRYMQYFDAVIIFTLFSNIILIPWVFISLFLLKKIGEERLFFTGQNH